MRFSRLPLLWRVFAINAALLVVATLLLALTPVTIHASIALVEGIDLVVALARDARRPTCCCCATRSRRSTGSSSGCGRSTFSGPASGSPSSGGVEVGELVRAFNEMLERLETERRESGRRALRAQEAERLRIARGLHDEVGQVLTGVLLQLDSLAVPTRRPHELEETKQAVRQALEEVRRIAQRAAAGDARASRARRAR